MVTKMMHLEDNEFMMITEFMQNNFGINLSKKKVLIESRLNNYVSNKGYGNYGTYFKYALDDISGAEVSQMLNMLTTNYSYFMREWGQFEYFKDNVLPEAAERIKDSDLRVWSAGCSTGQEPYTLAMLISDFLKERGLVWDAKVLATDISEKALTAARNGAYNEESINNIPNVWKSKYFHKVFGDRWQINNELMDEVVFRRFNLIEDAFPFKKPLHVIFCRNVMIYFGENTKKKLIKKFYDATAPGGYLFIGQSEFLDKSDTQYKFIKPSIFKKAV